MKNILQVVGEARSGKSEVCTYLAEQHGFKPIVIFDIIRAYAQENSIKLRKRADYLEVHARMKQERGVDIVARTVLECPEDRLCVDGIRVVNDVIRIKNADGVKSKILALHCPQDVRFARAVSLKDGIDRLTYEEFVEDDKQDSYNVDTEHQNTLAVIGMADFHLDTTQPRAVVFSEVDAVIERFGADAPQA